MARTPRTQCATGLAVQRLALQFLADWCLRLSWALIGLAVLLILSAYPGAA